MSLRLKLGLLFLSVIILFAGSIWIFSTNLQQLQDITNKRRLGQVMLSTSEKLALGKQVLQSDLTDKMGIINQLMDDIFLMQAAVNTNLRIEDQAEVNATLREVQVALPAIQLLLQDLQVRLASGQSLAHEDILSLNQLDGIVGTVRDTVADYDQYLKTEENRVVARANLLKFVIIASMIGAVVAIFLVLFFNILLPINLLTQSAREISQGDFSHQVNIQSGDELGQLAAAFNTMMMQLRGALNTLEERVAARTRDLEIVAEVGTATATILESKRLLQEVVDLTKERFNLYHSHIYLLDETNQHLVLTAGAGEPGRIMVGEGRSIPLYREQSIVARAARERRGVTVNDVTQAPDFLPNPLLPDTRSELAVPMIVGGSGSGGSQSLTSTSRPLWPHS
jgi:HAMP domain-containing protein/putative methionine-R-sulfoxide reductase with GAF domain